MEISSLFLFSILHPVKNDVVRVVTVKTSNGAELKRPVVKLALLPTAHDEEDETITMP